MKAKVVRVVQVVRSKVEGWRYIVWVDGIGKTFAYTQRGYESEVDADLAGHNYIRRLERKSK